MLLMVYWFNPLIWLAYAFFCKDIEFACDEQVTGLNLIYMFSNMQVYHIGIKFFLGIIVVHLTINN